ncbi:MAG TPA: diguanylate cyclase, partial [Blastocatellia bacterium]|nr:diguanylate cyclase [Blastocatellia bacterium]
VMEQKAVTVESKASRWLITAVSVIGLSIFACAFYDVAAGRFHKEWFLLSIVTILVVSRTNIQIPKISSTLTLDDTFIFISVLLHGVTPSVVLAGANAAVCSLHYSNRRKVLPFNIAVMSLSVFVSSTIVTLVFGDLTALSSNISQLILAAELLALLQYLLNSGIVSAVNALRDRRNIKKKWRESFLWTSVTYFAGAVAACLIVKLIESISFYSFITGVPILAATYLTYKNYLNKVQASINQAEQMVDLHMRTIEALAIAIDSKDEVNHDHVQRVQIYATGLARLFHLSDAEVEALKAGALLHDIGKLAVPDYILNKPGPLTPAEYERMKVHTTVGAEILERVGFPYPVVPVVRHHHERWDGRGYPDGLGGEEIPITARILAVADCFDTLLEDRHYRRAMTPDQAIEIIKGSSGAVYDPEVVRIFLDHLPEFEAEIKEQKIDRQTLRPQIESAAIEPRAKDTGRLAFEKIRNAHREVIMLYDIAKTIGTSLDLRDTFAVFSSRLQDIVSYTTCALYLLRDSSGEVEASLVAGKNAERIKNRKMAAGQGIAGWVTANRQPMHNCDPRLDFDALRIEVPEQYNTAAVVPLAKGGETYGALALYSTESRPYDTDHLRLVEAVAKLASDAIANALHHELTEANALSDSLTGLANARALRRRFQEEALEADRVSGSFALLMIDLDGFKKINDTLGHSVGDQTLREFGRLMSTQVRGSDFLCRYAGDEFVILAQSTSDEVVDMARRLERAVDAHDFGFNGSGVSLGASIGWACFGVEGDTLDELLIAADRAMYASKFSRKTSRSNSLETV